MNINYGTTTYLLDSGERHSLVIDRTTGLPLFYPNLFITTQVRNSKSNSHSSILSTALNVIAFLKFLDRNNINLEDRILNRSFLDNHELDHLRDFTQQNFSSNSVNDVVSNMSSLNEVEETKGVVATATQYMRLTTISEYFNWLSSQLISKPNANEYNQIDKVKTQIKSRRPSRKKRNQDKDHSLDDIQVEALFEVVRTGSKHNPYTSYVQRRNRLIVLLLYHLGLRRGELLSIKIEDIDFSKHQLKILRRADEPDDPRVNEPNAKTLERTLPLSETLSKEVHDYIIKDRRKVLNAKRNSFLFVTHKPGSTIGQPISIPGYHKIITTLKAAHPQLDILTGHKLRHTWNRKFSEQMDSIDTPPSEERQEQIRSYLMGWSPGSGSAQHYNKRFAQEQANKAALALQKTSGTRLPKDCPSDE